MMWAGLFSAVNILAMAGWMVLALLPRRPLTHSIVLYMGVALLCLAYAVLLALVSGGMLDPVSPAGAGARPGFGSIPAVRAIFASDGGVVIGWTHYLALDLFTGLWIARDADSKQFARMVQLPFLLATFLTGPVGLLGWLVLRERRARAAARQ